MLSEKLEVHSTLNPKLWTSSAELHPDVEEKLFGIVDLFTSNLSIPIDVIDARLVGSNASYNYTQYSDIDLHIVANFESIDVDPVVLQSAYNLEKGAFNKNYDIKIHGLDVEVYIEDLNAATITNGIYSLYLHKWIKFPKKIEVPDVDVSRETNIWTDKIEDAVDTSGEKAKELLNSIYLVRKNSLEVDGEFGKGNVLFKELRNLGLLDKLRTKIKQSDSERLSLEAMNESMLTEASRNSLLTKSKTSIKGRQRYNRRNKSKVANSVKQFNSIDMDKLFKQDILTVNVAVNGETDDYVVRISFGGFLEILHDEIERNNGKLELKPITRALITGFNKDDVFIGCTCPDFYYRFGYWTTRNGVSSIDPQNIPSNITNPSDKLGSGCKHVLLVLSNNSWLIKCASVINNYVRYMEQHYPKLYADVIYPAIYKKPYEEPVQLSLFDTEDDELATDKDTLDKANTHTGRDDKGRFASGNNQGVKFASDDSPKPAQGQLSLFDDEP